MYLIPFIWRCLTGSNCWKSRFYFRLKCSLAWFEMVFMKCLSQHFYFVTGLIMYFIVAKLLIYFIRQCPQLRVGMTQFDTKTIDAQRNNKRTLDPSWQIKIKLSKFPWKYVHTYVVWLPKVHWLVRFSCLACDVTAAIRCVPLTHKTKSDRRDVRIEAASLLFVLLNPLVTTN